MIMKKIIFTILSLLLFTEITFSLDTVSTKYYPLKVGNSWTYYYYQDNPPQNYRYKNTIKGTAVYNNHFYYIFTRYNDNLRIDSGPGWLYITAIKPARP